jgi:hypothetical protein
LVYLYYINSWSDIKSMFEVWSIIKITNILLCTETCIRLLVTAIFKLGTHTLKDSKTDFEFKHKYCAFYAPTSDTQTINIHNSSDTRTEHVEGSKHAEITAGTCQQRYIKKKHKKQANNDLPTYSIFFYPLPESQNFFF